MDYVRIAGSDETQEGLAAMLDAAEQDMGNLIRDSKLVDVPTALLVISVSERADDRIEWFPGGRWATIQLIQYRCDVAMQSLFGTRKDGEG